MSDVQDTAAPVVEDTQAPEGTEQPKSWLEQLPEEARKDPNISKYKTPDEFIKGHQNLVKLVGAKGVIVPKEDAPAEEKDKFYNSLGRPEKPEGYKITPVELHPKIKESYTPEVEATFKSEMHKLGLTQSQVDGLHKWYFENASKGEVAKEQATEKALKDGESALRAEWKDKYDVNLNNAKKVANRFGGKEAIEALGDLGSHPAIVKMLGNIAANFSEDVISDVKTKQVEGNEGAKAKIKAIHADKSHPYWKGDSAAIKEVTQLYKEAYPDEK